MGLEEGASGPLRGFGLRAWAQLAAAGLGSYGADWRPWFRGGGGGRTVQREGVGRAVQPGGPSRAKHMASLCVSVSVRVCICVCAQARGLSLVRF